MVALWLAKLPVRLVAQARSVVVIAAALIGFVIRTAGFEDGAWRWPRLAGVSLACALFVTLVLRRINRRAVFQARLEHPRTRGRATRELERRLAALQAQPEIKDEGEANDVALGLLTLEQPQVAAELLGRVDRTQLSRENAALTLNNLVAAMIDSGEAEHAHALLDDVDLSAIPPGGLRQVLGTTTALVQAIGGDVDAARGSLRTAMTGAHNESLEGSVRLVEVHIHTHEGSDDEATAALRALADAENGLSIVRRIVRHDGPGSRLARKFLEQHQAYR